MREEGTPADALMNDHVSNVRLPDEEVYPHPNYNEFNIPE